MYYTIYKITNKLDGKIYIGVHKTTNLDDEYMGSGKYLKRSQEKYGIENFEKEILEVFDNPEAMFEMEAKLVNPEFVERKDTYNLIEGGYDGFRYINAQGLNNKVNQNLKGSAKHQELLKSDLDYRNRWYSNCRNNFVCGFEGKKHTEETKRKMSEAKQGTVDGEKNPNYGNIWIYSDREKISKLIKQEEFIEWESAGWMKGRKIKFM